MKYSLEPKPVHPINEPLHEPHIENPEYWEDDREENDEPMSLAEAFGCE